MALRIGLLRSSELENDGHIKPVILQCRTPQETTPKSHWGPNRFLRKSLFLHPPWWSWYVLGPSSLGEREGAAIANARGIACNRLNSVSGVPFGTRHGRAAAHCIFWGGQSRFCLTTWMSDMTCDDGSTKKTANKREMQGDKQLFSLH